MKINLTARSFKQATNVCIFANAALLLTSCFLSTLNLQPLGLFLLFLSIVFFVLWAILETIAILKK